MDKMLPDIFSGFFKFYVDHKTEPKNKSKNRQILSEEARKVLSKRMVNEIELYNFVQQRFNKQLMIMG